jgi:hypothetical protein
MAGKETKDNEQTPTITFVTDPFPRQSTQKQDSPQKHNPVVTEIFGGRICLGPSNSLGRARVGHVHDIIEVVAHGHE